jgi:adenine deaminase
MLAPAADAPELARAAEQLGVTLDDPYMQLSSSGCRPSRSAYHRPGLVDVGAFRLTEVAID